MFICLDLSVDVVLRARDLSGAVQRAESLRERRSVWPPGCDGNGRKQPALSEVMADEMGFLD